jgi:hypothetical protein
MALLSNSAQAPMAETSFRAIVEAVIPLLSDCNFVGVSRVPVSGHAPEGGLGELEIAAAGGSLQDGSVAAVFGMWFERCRPRSH